MSNGTEEKDIERLRGNIEDTRQRISGEIEAIGERLTPGHARDVAKERMVVAKDRAIARGRTSARNAVEIARNTPSEVPRAIRDNPIPAALVVGGTGWLAWKAISRAREHRQVGFSEAGLEMGPGYARVPAYEEGVYVEEGEPSVGARERVGSAASRTREKVSSTASRTREKLGSAASRTREKLGSAKSSARDRLSGSASSIKGRASDLAVKGRERASDARVRGQDAFSSNPFAFGALALFTGIGIGMLLPHTRREDRMLGSPRERVVERAKHMAAEAKDVAVHSAKEGVRAAKETAKEDRKELSSTSGGGNL